MFKKPQFTFKLNISPRVGVLSDNLRRTMWKQGLLHYECEYVTINDEKHHMRFVADNVQPKSNEEFTELFNALTKGKLFNNKDCFFLSSSSKKELLYKSDDEKTSDSLFVSDDEDETKPLNFPIRISRNNN